MALPSFDSGWKAGQRTKPRIYVLEIRDRAKPDGDAIAWLLVERQEIYRRDERDDSIFEASIRLSYERIEPKHSRPTSGKGNFCGGYSRGFGDRAPLVSLTSESTSKGAVFLDLPGLQGQRTGTYLMNEIVTWAQQWPDASVCPVELLDGQAHGENKVRRNRFYEQFGLKFDYRDPEHREGVSLPIPAKNLTPVDAWKVNLCERDLRDYLGEVLSENQRLKLELSMRDRAVKDLSGDIKRAEAQPVRWALRRFGWHLRSALGGLAILLLFSIAAWSGLKTYI